MALDAIDAGAVQRAPVRVEGAGRERDVADGVRDAGDLRDLLDRRGGEPRGRDDVDGFSVVAAADGDGRVGADDGVGRGQAAGARARSGRRPSVSPSRRRA